MDAKMFGAFLAQVRRAQGLTQAELAEQLHVCLLYTSDAADE